MLRVFFVGTERVQGALDDKTSWPGRTAWANALTDDRRTALQGLLEQSTDSEGGKVGALAEKPYLTVFDDSSSPRPGTSDLFFSRATDQSSVERPPIIQTVEVDEPMLSLGAGAGWAAVAVIGCSALVLVVVLGAMRWAMRSGAWKEG
jgi:hypothetical protein